ncbi:MAG: PQQ-like beta-propeller repeat protein [Gemmataceae bacterium]|nr:PQQ-like beta-propeller repeat protein [Gemmataceae bacterium]
MERTNASHVTRRAFLGQSLAAMSGITLGASLAAADPSANDPASWAQFLGPRRDGISLEKGLNTDWQKRKPKLAWKAPLGNGFSSVAVVGDRLYTMTKRGERDIAVCLNTSDGKEVWATEGVPSYRDKQGQGAGPRATPTVHNGKVFCLFAMGDLFCINAADGKEVWKTNIFEASGAKNRVGDFYYWGVSGSPLIEGDFVIVQPGGNKDNSVVAFRTDNGKMAWGAGDDPMGYSSAVVITAGNRRQVVSFTGQSALGIDPLKGTLLWRYALGNKYECNCATPLWAEDTLFISSAYGTGCAALQLSVDGDKVTAKEKWRNKDLMNQFTTSVILKGHLYGCHGDLGAVFLRCLDLATGKILWEDRGPGKCSLLAYEDHMVLVNERGKVRLIEANPKAYTVKGELDDVVTYKTWAAPALLNKRLYLRDDKVLACVDLAG